MLLRNFHCVECGVRLTPTNSASIVVEKPGPNHESDQREAAIVEMMCLKCAGLPEQEAHDAE